MKKQFLIFISTILFAFMFYNLELGINTSIFVLVILLAQFALNTSLIKNTKALLLGFCVVVSCISNAWLISPVTVLSVLITSFVFRYYTVYPEMKLLSNAFNFVLSWPAFIGRIFLVDQWFEFKKEDSKKTIITLFSYIILPLGILSIFFALYVSSSEWLSKWYNRYEWNIDGLIIFTIIVGFYISFVFWHIHGFNFIKVIDKSLQFNFSNQQKNNLKPTLNYIPVSFEMRSGIITLVSLNCMLLFFIIVFNVENAQQSIQHLSEYSSRTHSQVYLIIVSVFLAMAVVLFFFKDTLNFVKNNKWLLQLSKIWIGLNAILIVSAFYQNTVYINALGLTYKRLGVYMFLIICLIGLIYSFLKIVNQKTNFYLIDRITWTLFYTLVFCATFNWGGIITKYNMRQPKFDLNYVTYHLFGNEKLLIQYFKQNNIPIPDEIQQRIKYHKNLPFLSKQLYYQSIQ